MDPKLLATIIAIAKKEASANSVDISNLQGKVERQLKEFHSRSPILETPEFFVKNGCLHCKWQSGLTLDFGNIVGPQGPQGSQGAQGVAGKDGEIGKDGVDGKDGKDGRDGKDGKAAAAGRDGVDGKDGRMGPQGPRGAPGPVGQRGEVGKDGKAGEKGSQGLPGQNGLDGEDGVGIEKAWVDDKYHLTLRLTSGKVVDAGYVRGKPGSSSGKGGRVTGSYLGGGVSQSQTVKLLNPSFTYSGGLLSLVSYDGGHTKALTYNATGALLTSATTINGVTTTKTFTYNPDGSLASVTNS